MLRRTNIQCSRRAALLCSNFSPFLIPGTTYHSLSRTSSLFHGTSVLSSYQRGPSLSKSSFPCSFSNFRYLSRSFHTSSPPTLVGSSSSSSPSSSPPLDLSRFSQEKIRNFAVIAHIDHGKTSISNRLLEMTGTTSVRVDSSLDSLQVERERGITVKAHATTMRFTYQGEEYLLNLIDTPGHVDFTYEVSRALKACSGVLLVVDASQGVQAQTVANFYLAFEHDLEIIAVINKIDMPTAHVSEVLTQIQQSFGIQPKEVLLCSAKTGEGLDNILPAVVERIPPPVGSSSSPLQALLFDSWFDKFRGVVCLIKITNGTLKKGDKVKAAGTGQTYEALEIGILHPTQTPVEALYCGQVGYLIAGMKTTREARVGDTIIHLNSNATPLPGFKAAKPMVYAGLYPVDQEELDKVRDAINKLLLTDASVSVTKEQSDALGMGFRCGFLGLLHMEVFVQRLEQEYGVTTLITAPTVPYKVILTDGSEIEIHNPSQLPDQSEIRETFEPIVNANIVIPVQYLGVMMKLCHDRRGEQKELTYLDPERVLLKYVLPLSEIVSNFYDRLKELSSGYATFDYEECGYQSTSLSKLCIHLNGKIVDPLSLLIHKSKVETKARELVAKLKELIDRQLFQIAIQATVGNKVVARETLSALRKNVTAKCYGGDITRKRKLSEKQKEGKKRMKQVGDVSLSQEAFLAALTTD